MIDNLLGRIRKTLDTLSEYMLSPPITYDHILYSTRAWSPGLQRRHDPVRSFDRDELQKRVARLWPYQPPEMLELYHIVYDQFKIEMKTHPFGRQVRALEKLRPNDSNFYREMIMQSCMIMFSENATTGDRNTVFMYLDVLWHDIGSCIVTLRPYGADLESLMENED